MRKLLPIACVLLFAACVPQKKYLDATSRMKRLAADSISIANSLADCNKKSEVMAHQLDDKNLSLQALQEDTGRVGNKYRQTKALYDNLDAIYDRVIQQNKSIQDELTNQKQSLNTDLAAKQDALDKKEQELNGVKAQLDKKQHDADSLSSSLSAREAKVHQLEDALNKKDSAVQQLKRAITNALLGFDKSDLTIEQKNGRVYVSMSEQLLFKNGSTVVETKGVGALKKLADALTANPGIDIMVEGHTDNKPLNSPNYPKDNLDLSVLRATSVGKILINDGLSDSRIVCSGRGDTEPVADNSTAEGRAKNRRTEIILTPKLDAVLKALGAN